MAEFNPRKDGIDFYDKQVSYDEKMVKYLKMIEKMGNRFSQQEAGRATYQVETLDKDGMTLILDKEKLAQMAREGFGVVEQEEQEEKEK